MTYLFLFLCMSAVIGFLAGILLEKRKHKQD